MDKQPAGFKYGKWRTQLIRTCGEVKVGIRVYRLVLLQTYEGQCYYALRIYNNGHFIKQLLFETTIIGRIARMLLTEAVNTGLAALMVLLKEGGKDNAKRAGDSGSAATTTSPAPAGLQQPEG